MTVAQDQQRDLATAVGELLRDSLRDELAAMLRQFRITAVFVTHDQSEAMAIADRIAVMSSGTMLQVGRPEELYHAPANAFVARFIGNAMPLAGQMENGVLHLPGGRLQLPASAADKTAYIRSENIRLDQAGSLVGKVETVTFSGGHFRLAVGGVLPDGSLLYLQHPGRTAPESGSTVRLTIDPSDLIYLADQTSTHS